MIEVRFTPAHMHRARVSRIVTAALCAVITTGVAAAAEDAGRLTGGTQHYQVVAGDTWRAISARVGVDASTLARDNGRRLDRALKVGDVLTIDNRHIVPDAATKAAPLAVNVPQRMLFFLDGNGAVVAFPVAVGKRDWPTPLKPFRIVSRERDPSWEVPQSIRDEALRARKTLPAVVPPGPDNPLGKYWLGLSIGDVGIHGTNAPASIYGAVTHGCIRLHPDNIAWLFEHVDVGTAGAVIYEPVLLTTSGGDVFLEAHRDVYGKAGNAEDAVHRRVEAMAVADRIDWRLVSDVLRRRDGIARRVTADVQTASW